MVQFEDDDFEEYFPGSQNEHTIEPATENVPAGQLLQTWDEVAPVMFENLPGGHAKHPSL